MGRKSPVYPPTPPALSFTRGFFPDPGPHPQGSLGLFSKQLGCPPLKKAAAHGKWNVDECWEVHFCREDEHRNSKSRTGR